MPNLLLSPVVGEVVLLLVTTLAIALLADPIIFSPITAFEFTFALDVNETISNCGALEFNDS